MSEYEICQLPTSDLYWTKQELSDQIFNLSRKMQRIKTPSAVESCQSEIIYLNNSIEKIEQRMQQLYM